MPFKETFSEFYSKVKTSLEDGTFAKMTMAKTIGNTDLKNIYIRLIVEEGFLKMELKFRYQEEEILEIHPIDGVCDILIPYLSNPFLTVILFTTEFDLTYKMNKKKAVTVSDQAPTFGNASPVLLEYLESKK